MTVAALVVIALAAWNRQRPFRGGGQAFRGGRQGSTLTPVSNGTPTIRG